MSERVAALRRQSRALVAALNALAPEDLLGRVRALFLGFGAIVAVSFLAQLGFASVGSGWLALAAAGCLVGLVGYWIVGYRTGAFPVVAVPLEALALITVGLALPNPRGIFGLLYCGLILRALYGGASRVAVVAIAYLGAFLAVVMIRSSDPAASISPENLVQGVPLVLMAAAMHTIGRTLERHQQALARERILREAGVKLVAAIDRDSLYAAALDAVAALLPDRARARITIAVGSTDEMRVVAADGHEAERARGTVITARAFPAPLRDALLQRRPVHLDRLEPTAFRESLEFVPKTTAVSMTPIVVDDELRGMFVVATEAPLGDPDRAALEALGSLVALALTSSTLRE